MRAEAGRRIALLATVLLALASLGVHAVDSAPAIGVEGRSVFTTRGCSACHTAAGVDGGSIGPDLTALFDRAGSRVPGLDAEQYVRQSILEPQAFLVPGFGAVMPALDLTDQEVDAVVGFLARSRP